MKASLSASQLNKLSVCKMGHPHPSPTCRRKPDTPLPTVLLCVETTNKYRGEQGWQARPKAYLWPGVSCDQTLQDQRVPLPNCVNAFTDVVFLHHACLPSMDDLGLSRSCGEERRGKEGNEQFPISLCPLPRVASPTA